MDFYATIKYGQIRDYMPDGVCYLLPASSWARGTRKDGSLPPVKLPLQVKRVAADSGGFVAARKWGGKYRYTPAQYVDWLKTFSPEWAATMDFCCEPPIAGSRKIIYQRQDSTTRAAWHFWNTYRSVAWAWVPTIQGWDVEDYVRHAREMKPLIMEMKQHYKNDPRWRVGIGTLCARASTSMIQAVVTAVAAELPGVKFHLWGVKLNLLKSGIAFTQVCSVDSAAWSPGGLGRDGAIARKERLQMGISENQYGFRVALPRYLNKVTCALNQTKQLVLI